MATCNTSYTIVGLYETGRTARVNYNGREDAVFEFAEGRLDVIAARSQLADQIG